MTTAGTDSFDRACEPTPARTPAQTPARTPAPRVLLVEDDQYVVLPLQRTLEAEGYSVTTVVCGADALEHLAYEGVELVVLDLGLPDMDGIDVCRQARLAGFEGAILVETAREGEADRVLALAAGADDYLTKPFELAAFAARAREQVRRVGRVADPVPPAPGAARRAPAATRPAPVQPLEVQLWPREFDPAEIATPPTAPRRAGRPGRETA